MPCKKEKKGLELNQTKKCHSKVEWQKIKLIRLILNEFEIIFNGYLSKW